MHNKSSVTLKVCSNSPTYCMLEVCVEILHVKSLFTLVGCTIQLVARVNNNFINVPTYQNVCKFLEQITYHGHIYILEKS